jgi:hypothetical protein
MGRPRNGLPRPPAHPRGKSGLLAAIGIALYGEHGYVVPLAKLLDVTDKTVRRWLDGGTIPGTAWYVLQGEAERRSCTLNAYALKIDQYLKE